MRFAAVTLLLASTVLASPAPVAQPEAAAAPAPVAEPASTAPIVLDSESSVEALSARIAALEARIASPDFEASTAGVNLPRDPKGGGGKGGGGKSGGGKGKSKSKSKGGKIAKGGSKNGTESAATMGFEPNRILQAGALGLGVMEIVRLWG
ncbi:hypothetical protein BU24DRAFT_412499 [Aaosphaeria arxii CBS 175.79]|uniref:Uncharacterized protein n=1 Tax=Aaosphaeria arxii CBS 175.79 TaxID=1450172 RepID=A0A6A5XI09_9PLEO|nr:uncharacterized protein BU24DRAFT_412499 [Aaosphaeria arxii CBS 175.79]KAF2011954.1 hypothetical protein BU24DRAFT_412499 [Aaosphaeria arxii CBS 175.79]